MIRLVVKIDNDFKPLLKVCQRGLAKSIGFDWLVLKHLAGLKLILKPALILLSLAVCLMLVWKVVTP